MANAELSAVLFAFGSLNQFEFDPRALRLYEYGSEVDVEPLALHLLRHLLEHRQGFVSQSDLLDEVWKGRNVKPPAVKRAIHVLRKKLKDDPRQPQLIANDYGRGYRFIGAVQVEVPASTFEESKVEHRIDYVRFAEHASGANLRICATFLYPLTSRARAFQREKLFQALEECAGAQLLFLDPASRQSIVRALERRDEDFFLRQEEMLGNLRQDVFHRAGTQVRLFDARPSLHVLQAGSWISAGPYYQDRAIDDSTRLDSTSKTWERFITPLFEEVWSKARPLMDALETDPMLRLLLQGGAEARLARRLWTRFHAAEALRLGGDHGSARTVLGDALLHAEEALGAEHAAVRWIAQRWELEGGSRR